VPWSIFGAAALFDEHQGERPIPAGERRLGRVERPQVHILELKRKVTE
jgi:hypothetical protein